MLRWLWSKTYFQVKFIYSEKATKFCKISIVDLPYSVMVKSTVEILQKFVAFSEYMNFIPKQTNHIIFWTWNFDVLKASNHVF